MTIAVDFDGTIVEHRYPEIGKEIPHATATLRQLILDGHKLILWTVREGKLLEEAIKWCEEKGIRFYAVNKNTEEDTADPSEIKSYSRKLKASVFIDDRNIGGLPDWGVIYQLISQNISLEEYLLQNLENGQEKKTKRFYWPF